MRRARGECWPSVFAGQTNESMNTGHRSRDDASVCLLRETQYVRAPQSRTDAPPGGTEIFAQENPVAERPNQDAFVIETQHRRESKVPLLVSLGAQFLRDRFPRATVIVAPQQSALVRCREHRLAARRQGKGSDAVLHDRELTSIVRAL